jgi:hypothetical protein
MQPLKILKRRDMLPTVTVDLSLDEQRGIAEYRAFEPIASLYASRICNLAALEVMMAINDAIGRQLTERREMLNTSPSDFAN